MNKVVLMGRLTRDPEVRYSQGDAATAVARYTLAVDRRFRRQGDEQTADFISCVSFGKTAEFVERYLKQGTKIAGCGRIQTGSYTNRDGVKVYTTDVIVEEQEFAESKAVSQQNNSYRAPAAAAPAPAPAAYSASPAPAPMPAAPDTSADGFMNIPDSIDEELPFN